MPEIVSCPQCQRRLRLPENALGRRVRCAGCQNTFKVEPPRTEAASLAVTAAPPAPPPRPTAAAERPRQDSPVSQLDERYPPTVKPARKSPPKPKGFPIKIAALIAIPVGLVLVLGVVFVGIVLAMLGASSTPKKQVVLGPPVVPLEDKQQREKEIKEAFQEPKQEKPAAQDLPPPVQKAEGKIDNPKPAAAEPENLQAELTALFTKLGEAYRAKDGDAIANHFDGDRLLEEVYAQGVLPRMTAKELRDFKAGAAIGVRQSLPGAMTKQADLVHWTAFEIKHIKKLGPTEVVVIVRHRETTGEILRMRWWLAKRAESWKVYDQEDLEFGQRLTVLMGTVMAGLDVASMQRLSLAISELRAGFVALVTRGDVQFADQKLQSVAGIPLPDCLEAWRWMLAACVHVRSGQYQETLNACDKANAYQPDIPVLNLIKAIALNKLGKADEAIKHLTAYRDLLGDDNNVCREMGEAYRVKGRFQEAASWFRKALNENPKDADAFLDLIQVLALNDNRDDLAERFAKLDFPQVNFEAFAADCKQARDGPTLELLCQAMRKIDPRHPTVGLYDALAKAWNQKPKEAAAMFRIALARENDANLRKEFSTEFLLAMAGAGTGAAVEAYGVVPDGREAFRVLAAELKKAYRPEDLKQLVTLHAKQHANDDLLLLYQGEIYVQEDKYALADKAFTAAAAKVTSPLTLKEFRPSRVLARYYTGRALPAYEEIGPKQETFQQLAFLCWGDENLELLQQLVAVHAKNYPEDGDTLHWQCRLKIKQGEFDQAIALFRRASLKADPQSKRQQMLSTFLYDMVDAGQFLKAYEAAPDSRGAFQTLANDLHGMGQSAELRQLMDVHRANEANDVWLTYFTGQLQLNDKAWEQAAATLLQAWSQAPPDLRPRFRDVAVWAMYKAGKTMQAHADIEPRRDTFVQLANCLLGDKKGQELEALIAAHRAKAGEDADVLNYQARAKVLLKQFAAAAQILQQAHQKQQDPYLRASYINAFVLDMYDAGQALDGYRAAPDKKAAFETLARELVFKKQDKLLAELQEEHAKGHPADPWFRFYQGELHLLRGEADKADTLFAALKAESKTTDPWYWSSRTGLIKARIKAGKAVATYQEFGPSSRNFDDLALQCQQQKNGAELESLVAAHRQQFADDLALPMWEVEVRWLKKDYEGVLQLLNDRREELSQPRNKWRYEGYLVRSLVKLGRLEEAVKQAELIGKRKSGNRVLLVLAHAARGDAKLTIAAVAKLGPGRFLVEDCYRDEELGPILRSEAFSEFRERFPEPEIRNGRFTGDLFDD